MAVITALQSGLSSSGSTWVGGVPPQDGVDRVIIPTGVTVTVDQNAIWGDSPASGTDVLTFQGSGSLVINEDITLEVRGELQGGNGGSLTGLAGSTLQFTAASGVTYENILGDGNGQSFALVFEGEADNRCSVVMSGDGLVNFTYGAFVNIGSLDASYTDFSGFGAAGTDAIRLYLSLYLSHCRFVDMGELETSEIPATLGMLIEYCNWKSSPGDYCVRIRVAEGNPGVSRAVSNSVFDKQFVTPTNRMHIIRNVFLTGIWGYGSDNLLSFSGNFVVNQPFQIHVSDIVGNFFYSTASNNPHFLTLSAITDQVVSNNMFQYGRTPTSDDGDCILLSSGLSADIHYSVIGNITLPNSTGGISGTLVSQLGDTHTFVDVIRNNTSCGRVAIGETYAGFSGMFASIRDNIFWNTGATTDYKVMDVGAGAAAGSVVYADYNTGYQVGGYNADSAVFQSTPGGNDLDIDPQFVDSSRGLWTWVSDSLGYAGNDDELRAFALLIFGDMNDPDGTHYVEGLTPETMMSWIEAGFEIQAELLFTASSEGSYVGAVAPDIETSDVVLSLENTTGTPFTIPNGEFTVDAFGTVDIFSNGFSMVQYGYMTEFNLIENRSALHSAIQSGDLRLQNNGEVLTVAQAFAGLRYLYTKSLLYGQAASNYTLIAGKVGSFDYLGTSASRELIDPKAASNYGILIESDCQFVFKDPVETNVVFDFFVFLEYTSNDVYSITWPGTVKWEGGSSPTPSCTSGAVDIFQFRTVNGSYFGSARLGYLGGT